MFPLLKQVCKDIFTGIDGRTYHMAKFSWAFCMLVISAVMVHRAWSGLEVDLMAAAGALVAIATGHSAAIYGMKSTEPTPPESNK
jgi:hypothetical protein